MKLKNTFVIFLITLFFSQLGFSQNNKTTTVISQSPIPKVSAGKIVRLDNFPSKYVVPRNIDIWLPENFNPKKKYSVIYMHDGQMLFDASITWNNSEWKVDENLDKLKNKANLKDAIVVGIWNIDSRRYFEYYPEKPFNSLSETRRNTLLKTIFSEKPQSDNYLKFIVEELKPFVDQNYPTRTDRKNTFIMGSSMGGLISMYAMCEYPEVFGGAACLSTHWIGDSENQNNELSTAFENYLSQNLPSPKTHKFYFDFGTVGLDGRYEEHQDKVDLIMKKKGYDKKSWMTNKVELAEHSEKFWSERLWVPLEFLLKTK